MAYTKEQLFDLPVSRLVDIIMSQQEQLMQSDADSKMLNRIRKILDAPDTTNEGNTSKGNNTISLEPSSGKRRPGRPKLSPEESAKRYAERKARQKERYKEMMAEIREYNETVEGQEAPKEAE